jgi:hypothetical protein
MEATPSAEFHCAAYLSRPASPMRVRVRVFVFVCSAKHVCSRAGLENVIACVCVCVFGQSCLFAGLDWKT